MKLMASRQSSQQGFALPTILLVSIAMITVLLSAIGAAAGSRVSLDSQYYNLLARQAAESGVTRANECLKSSGYKPQWTVAQNDTALRPGTYCTGTGTGYSAYVVDTPQLRTSFSIDAPSGSGIGSSLKVTGTTELLRSSTNAVGLHDVWRTYDYVTYLRIEPPETSGCPDGFASVPGSSTYGTSDFCVGKYEAKEVNGMPVSQPNGAPRVWISQTEAAAAAANACSGCHLITEAEWLTIAQNVVNVASNWTSGRVGIGAVYIGHNNNNPPNALEASADDSQGYYGTGLSSGSQRRTLTLSNGQVIWDFSGNVFEWTAGQIGAGKPGASGSAWREWNAFEGTGSASPNPFPSFGTAAASGWTSGNGMGKFLSDSDDTTTKGFIRSGSWSMSYPGVYMLMLSNAPTSESQTIGFRLAR